jgi:hypothetical protein
MILERQRLHDRIGDDKLEPLRVVEQRVDARTHPVRAKVAAHPIAKHPGLADVQGVTRRVEEHVNARLLGQAGDLGLEITDGHAVHCAFQRRFCNLPV